MWNQTAAAATSDNNKEKETVEDCHCAGGSVASTSSAASVEQQRKPAATAPASPSAIETNSKKSKSETVTTTTATFGGKSNENNSQQQSNSNTSTNAAINKQKEFAAQSETSDSGFISGPQSGPIFSEEILSDNEGETPQSNQQQQQQQQSEQDKQQQGKQQAVASAIFDSGVVEEVEDDDDVEDTHPTTEAGRTVQPATVGQMRLKDNVDAGIPQWTVAPRVGLNNLDATPKPENPIAATTAIKRQPAGNIMNAWEQFYQQNDDGDTWVTQAFPTFHFIENSQKMDTKKH